MIGSGTNTQESVLTAAAARSRGIDGGEEALDAAAATRMSRCGEDQPHFDASGDLFEVKSLSLSVQTRFTNLAFPPEHWPEIGIALPSLGITDQKSLAATSASQAGISASSVAGRAHLACQQPVGCHGRCRRSGARELG